MLEVVYGETRHRALSVMLAQTLTNFVSDGILYLGYPVLASADERVFVDALLVSGECGLTAFQIADSQPSSADEWAPILEDQDRLYSLLESHLRRHDALRAGRRLLVDIHTVTVFGGAVQLPTAVRPDDGLYAAIANVPGLLADFSPLDTDLLRALQGALQHVSTIKPAKRRDGVVRTDSRGAILKRIEKGIANLDQWQRQAAIETPEGPQRIRGLAGSGKTIVLALKAAYLHAKHPDWRVVVTFHSRALYQQFEDLITRFTFEQTDDKPDLTQLQILHSWGSSQREGVYSTIARHLGVSPRDFNYGLARYGRDGAFAGVCQELLDAARPEDPPIFDAALIDEAQDLPPSFFRLLHRFTKAPKRVAWAYDELQKLDEGAMASMSELFGADEAGHSLVTLANHPGEARRDITLPICYRNSPWALATAHALGLGIYRAGGLVQHFDEPSLWEGIGYRLVSGRLAEGARVELERAPHSTPDYFPEFLTPNDAVLMKAFADSEAQDRWVARQLVRHLNVDEYLVVIGDRRRGWASCPHSSASQDGLDWVTKMADEKSQDAQPAQQGQQQTPLPDEPASPNGQPGYRPRPIDPALWHWVEKREAPPGEAKRQN